MQQEKTVEMELKRRDIDELRASIHVCILQTCSHEGNVFFSNDPHQRVCDDCVAKAMAAEGFNVRN